MGIDKGDEVWLACFIPAAWLDVGGGNRSTLTAAWRPLIGVDADDLGLGACRLARPRIRIQPAAMRGIATPNHTRCRPCSTYQAPAPLPARCLDAPWSR